MIKMAELMKKKHLPCFAHSMNLVVQESIELPPIKQILSNCKQIVTFVKSSNNAFEIFKKEQNTNTPYKLVQEVTTRWNSVFYMVSRILKTHEALNRTLLKIKKAPPPLTADEIMVLKEIEKILISFEQATQQISGSKYVTISLIIPITFGIFNNLVSDIKPNITTEEGILFCNSLIESMQVRLFSYERRTVAQMGTLLDPRFKQEGFRSPENA